MSCTKATAPCNIDLDENEEKIIPKQTRTDCSRSTKQTQMDQEALDKEMATLSKRLKAYQKTKWQQEKKSSAPKTTAFNNDEEYESEERDPPMGQGFFVQSVTSLGTVTSSTQHAKCLCKYNEAPPFNDINNIFNDPASVVSHGRSPELIHLQAQ